MVLLVVACMVRVLFMNDGDVDACFLFRTTLIHTSFEILMLALHM